MYEGRVARAAAKCFASKDGRLIEIYDAGDTVKGFSGTVTVLLDIMNPKTNWDEVGFKIRTYEMTASGIALVDKLEGDALRPTLQCQAPCQYCEDGGTIAKASVDETEKSFSNGQIQVPKYVRGYCTRCWQDTPTKYL